MKSGTKSEMCVLRDNADYEEVDVREAERIMKGRAVRVRRLAGQVVKFL
jgi:hypothetical protein